MKLSGRLKKRAGFAAAIALVAACLWTGTASADPDNKLTGHLAVACDNGFTGTLVGIGRSYFGATLLVSDGTSAFVVVGFTLFEADDQLLFDYHKSAEVSGQSFTTCSFTGPIEGFYGTLVGRFTPLS